MFLLSQALDNEDKDICFQDGQLLDTNSSAVRPNLEELSDILTRGRARFVGCVEAYIGFQSVALKLATHDRDKSGRAAPLLLMVSMAELEDQKLLAADLARASFAMGREVNPRVHEDIAELMRSAGTSMGSRESDVKYPSPQFRLALWLRHRTRKSTSPTKKDL